MTTCLSESVSNTGTAVGRFHPSFNDVEGDIILCSSEGTLFRIPSFTLRMTSSYFRALLAQPNKVDEKMDTDTSKFPKLPSSASANRHHQPSSNSSNTTTTSPTTTTTSPTPTHHIHSPDPPLERVLRMLSGLETPPWTSFSELEDALDLIVQWDCPGPLSIIRASCTAPLFLDHPIRLYALGSRFGWEEVVRIASGLTLSINLFGSESGNDNEHGQGPRGPLASQETLQQLHRLSAPALMRLLAFHRKRRDEFRSLLDSSEMFNGGNALHYYCEACGEEVDNSSWRELKSRMVWEVDRCASGESVVGLEMEEWEEAVRCWGAVCRREGCGRVYYDKMCTLRDVRACIERLPKTV